MVISLSIISSMTGEMNDWEGATFWTPLVKTQARWFCLGWALFFAAAFFDYRKLREWSLFLYVAIVLVLAGLFFVDPIQNVHRWYRIPGLASVQPSEQTKLVVVIVLSWFLERKGAQVGRLRSALQMSLIVGIPFLLILKQPDLGTALVLYPIGLVLGYFAGIHSGVLRVAVGGGMLALGIVALFFLGTLSHEKMRPYFTTFMKEYQYERLNPHTYHQRAAQTAIAVGGVTGMGWRCGEFAGKKWLPFAHTDSVFAAFGEEFGFVGLVFLLFLFYALIYFSFQVAAVAKDPFGRLLATGLSAYLALHVLVNCAMMCALLPISGVPLILVTYGGSSLLTTMTALGLLQSIYSRRFMF
ncbi:MAG: FtsW/RodA/SpoVE family cell cycle protein [Chlamydiia bacterium]|nr:FtsW/RodA/SpoVE family cell cycle protein [Chlamydiia bacterium]